MADNTNRVSRRNVLKGVGAGLAATTAAGQAAAAGKGAYVVGVSDDHGLAKAREAAAEVKHEFDFDDIGKAVAGRFPEQAIEALEKNGHVRYVEADSEYQAYGQTTPWGIDRVDADVLHANGDTGAGADIAILDSGIDDDHPDLQANVQGGKAFGDIYCGSAGGSCRYGGSPNDNACNYAWSDDNNHGTHCAGTADAVDNTEGVVGVSTEANLWAGKVLDGCGSGSLSAIAAGIEWAADQGFDVASMSLGASSGDQTLKDAVQYADSKGLLMIAAAGNDGPCTDCVGYPAAYSEVMAVSSTASDDTLSDFSSTGPEVEIAAPGTDIESTVPGGYDVYSGTSMATPHVSGAAGQVMAGGATASEAKQALKDTAENIGLADNESGAGLLDAEAAVGGGGGSDDTTAPTAPSNLSSTGHTDSSVSLSWDASSDDGTGVDHYNVYVDGSKATESTDTAETVSGLSSGTTYDFYVTAVDGAGNESSASGTVSVTTDQSTSSAPTVDSHGVSTRTTGPWSRVTADWAVSDADGDLDSVVVEIRDGSGSTLASTTTSVSGSSASGSNELKTRGTPSESVVTVTDAAGNSSSSSKSL
jgi:subtilisin